MNLDDQARQIRNTVNAVGAIIDKNGNIECPHCGSQLTHVVDVVWEPDSSKERRRVRMELRCEDHGHGCFILITNHAGWSRIECAEITGETSPFAEGARW